MRHFIKLGGSLITDKTRPITPRPLTIARLAREIATAWRANPQRQWIISHGSGSYGHAMGQRYNIRHGVNDASGWQGFAQTGYIAGQLNRLVVAALLREGLPVVSLPPSALAQCQEGRIKAFHSGPVLMALERGVIPVVFGDVAFDETSGGVIISTEEVLAALANDLPPDVITLAGVVDGVYDSDPLRNPHARPVPHIHLQDLDSLDAALGGSHGVDVTGGMAGKVQEMADLIRQHPHLRVHLISGEIPGRLQQHLLHPEQPLGTIISV